MSVGLDMGFPSILQEPPGLLVQHTDGDLLLFEHTLHLVQLSLFAATFSL
jgi:hypothetical protein